MSLARQRPAMGVGAALCAAAALAVTALTTGGLANASAPPSVAGKKYSDAESVLSDAAFKPVISTTVGDQKAWPDCLVSNEVARTVAPPENSSGSATNEVLVSLNCYATNASAKGAGYSPSSPEGQAIAAAAKEKAAKDKAAAKS